MINLINHETDFGEQAEWCCHATADFILSPEKLLKWRHNHFKTIDTFFYSRKEHDKIAKWLKRRFNEAPAVPQIQKSQLHTK